MDNDDYNPEEPIYYNYKAKEFLLAELPQDSMCYDNIYICSYDVNTEGKYPFLRFLFTKTLFCTHLLLPQVFLFKIKMHRYCSKSPKLTFQIFHSLMKFSNHTIHFLEHRYFLHIYLN